MAPLNNKNTAGRQAPAPLLLVDDDPDQLIFLALLLRTEGFEVETCDSAASALELMTSKPFSLVVCDIQMPHITGLEFVRRARGTTSVPWMPQVPIILFSASPAEVGAHALEAGADMFFEKQQAARLLLSEINSRLK